MAGAKEANSSAGWDSSRGSSPPPHQHSKRRTSGSTQGPARSCPRSSACPPRKDKRTEHTEHISFIGPFNFRP